jgi:hypothetical protein
MNPSRKTSLVLFPFLAFSIVFGGCLSTSKDITPPPGRTSSLPTPTVDIHLTSESADVSDQVTPDTPSDTESSPQPKETVAADQGTVNVTIDNQSEGQTQEGEMQIRLEGFDHMNQVYNKTLPVENVEKFTFENVPFKTGRLFVASVLYRGAVYRSDIAEVEPEEKTLDLTVEVYGTTTDHEALQVERLHIFVDFPQSNVAAFGEIFIISNFGQRTVVTKEEGEVVLDFHLPSGAENVRFESGELGDRFLPTEDGFGDTMSIPPGSGVYQMLVFYDLPYRNHKLQFQQKMPLPVGAVVVMTPASDVRLKGGRFQDMGLREIQDGSIHVYVAEKLDQEELTFSLSGDPGNLPSPSEPTSPVTRQNAILGLSVFGGVLIAVGVWSYFRWQHDETSDVPFDADDFDKVEIMDAIIALDNRFEEGVIAETAYRQRRAELKSRLAALVRDEESL